MNNIIVNRINLILGILIFVLILLSTVSMQTNFEYGLTYFVCGIVALIGYIGMLRLELKFKI